MSIADNLVIVESPAKAGTIQKFLGKDYVVKSSFGHIRDLKDNSLSVDVEHGFAPEYVIPASKKKVVADLKAAADKAGTVWLASDEDREGEAISWHLAQTLGLDPAKTRRIVFHEITKDAILNAIQNPRGIDTNLVNAQQARRVLDRLVGFELSPILWRKVKRGLSAGRVQSVALRLVVDKEREIAAFVPEQFYRIGGRFLAGGKQFEGTLETRIIGLDQARQFLLDSTDASYTVESVEQKEGSRHPAPPFTTSTLQQEAAAKLRFPVSVTMRVAQSLYERGLITYMRTDSTNLSNLALGTAKQFIEEQFGPQYHHARQYKTKSRGAQEAHEALRPTYIKNTSIEGTAQEQKLYNLIWKRTVASQMEDARMLNTTVKLASDKRSEKFTVQSSTVLFDGFTALYRDDEEKNGKLPALKKGDSVSCLELLAECKFSQPPARYSEGTLVKKLEELGIGRPSTYASIVSTLTTGRGYIVKSDKEGSKVQVVNLSLSEGAIREKSKTELIGAEKARLIPQEIGMIVSDFLCGSFNEIMDYNFTARVEESFDTIAEGGKIWNEVIDEFYKPFHNRVESTMHDGQYSHVEREIGTDPESGQKIIARFGQFGPYVQKGEGEKRQCASLGKGQLIETLTLEEALKLFQLPRTVGSFEDTDIVATRGRFGPYLIHAGKNYSIPKGMDPLGISLEQCIAIIGKAREESPANSVILSFEADDISVINGRYGPYIKHAGGNYKIPKGTDAAALTLEDCRKIINESAPTSSGRGRSRRGGK